MSDIEAAHLHHVRAAVYHRRDIHPENRSEYKRLIPGLARYGLNGNLAVFDSTRPSREGKLTKGDIEWSDYLQRKETIQ